MRQATILFVAAASVAFAAQADAQGRSQDRRDRQQAARAQGVPPGQMPPANECRVWYDNRPPGRQPSPTSCSRAEAQAARDRAARVIYGENVYADSRYGRANGGPWIDDDRWPQDDRAVRRDGQVRDPRISGGILDTIRRGGPRNSIALENGYRDGMTKGREDAEDRDRFDVNRHSWYRSANRGYDNDYGNRTEYAAQYRQGFEAGYAEGYRVYARR